MYRLLKPGGRLIILEFFTPQFKLLNKAYDLYSFHVLPRISEIMVLNAGSYRYPAKSIRMHPDQEMLKSMILEAGLATAEYFNMTGGIVALHRSYKF